MKKYPFAFYALAYDFNSRKVKFINIFDNTYIYDNVVKALHSFLSFDELKKEILFIMKHELWARAQYEFAAGYKFETDVDNFIAIDCYDQVEANIDIILNMCMNITKAVDDAEYDTLFCRG